MKRFFDTVNVCLILIMAGFALWAWPQLPERIPVHFGVDGAANGWGERSVLSWFGPFFWAVAIYLLMGLFRVLMPRYPRLVNLPDRTRLSDMPEVARGPVLEMMAGFLALVQTGLLAVFGLIQYASYRAAMELPVQGIMITVLIFSILMSPLLLVTFFLRLQPALDRGKELARRAEAGVSGGGKPGP